MYGGGNPYTVVGIVEDARIADIGTEAGPQAYLPIQQQPQNYLSLVVRSREPGDVGALPAAIRAAVRAVDATLPIHAAQPMEAVVADGLAPGGLRRSAGDPAQRVNRCPTRARRRSAKTRPRTSYECEQIARHACPVLRHSDIQQHARPASDRPRAADRNR